MEWPKHDNREYTVSERREIIAAAIKKSNSCDLTWSLLELLDDVKIKDNEHKAELDRLDDIHDEEIAKKDEEIEILENRIKDIKDGVMDVIREN